MNSKRPLLILSWVALGAQAIYLIIAVAFMGMQWDIYRMMGSREISQKIDRIIFPWNNIIPAAVFLVLMIVFVALINKNLGNKYRLVGIIFAVVVLSNRIANTYLGVVANMINARLGVYEAAASSMLTSAINIFGGLFSAVAMSCFFVAAGMAIFYRD